MTDIRNRFDYKSDQTIADFHAESNGLSGRPVPMVRRSDERHGLHVVSDSAGRLFVGDEAVHGLYTSPVAPDQTIGQIIDEWEAVAN